MVCASCGLDGTPGHVRLALATVKELRAPFFSCSVECDFGPCHPRKLSETETEPKLPAMSFLQCILVFREWESLSTPEGGLNKEHLSRPLVPPPPIRSLVFQPCLRPFLLLVRSSYHSTSLIIICSKCGSIVERETA